MFGLLYDARREWRVSREPEETITQVYVKHALLLAMIPPFALFTGTTVAGALQGRIWYSSVSAVLQRLQWHSISASCWGWL